ncbi:MAG: zf-HC2 domain-containing protein [Planctomycetes bacterium]|nr:zf-HC2 domain-containing protein [Planctomycetota bacterium]
MSQPCQTWGSRASAWFDGEASELEAREVRTHLLDCAGCRAAVADWGTQRDELHLLQVEPPSEVALGRMAMRFQAGLAEEVHRVSTALRAWTTAAAILLIALVGMFAADRVFLPNEAVAAHPRDIERAVEDILDRPARPLRPSSRPQ